MVDLCPPLQPAEAAALQTAWLKQVCTELPAIAVFLFGRPADALPMLRYFAGPGVELREWRTARADEPPLAAMAAIARELFAEGHAPVLVRLPDAPDASEAGVLACAAAAARGEFVLASDQRGAPWLAAFPDASFAEAPHEHHPARGPWARRVQDADDFALLLQERSPAAEVRTLPVRDLQASLRFYETIFAANLRARGDAWAIVETPEFVIRLAARGADHAPNGLAVRVADPAALAARLRPAGCINPADDVAMRTDGIMDCTATDSDGNRLCFWRAR